jgi:hypothetical protein
MAAGLVPVDGLLMPKREDPAGAKRRQGHSPVHLSPEKPSLADRTGMSNSDPAVIELVAITTALAYALLRALLARERRNRQGRRLARRTAPPI